MKRRRKERFEEKIEILIWIPLIDDDDDVDDDDHGKFPGSFTLAF